MNTSYWSKRFFVRHFNAVAEAFGGDQGGVGAFALDDGVGGERGAVDDGADIGGAQGGAFQHEAYARPSHRVPARAGWSGPWLRCGGRPCSSTRSVKVPPMSMARRAAWVVMARFESGRPPRSRTEMPSGRLPMPTAERAGRPFSPNTSTNRSVQPLMTFGCCMKSGHRVHHAEHLQDGVHLVQRAEGRTHVGQQVQAALTGRPIGGVDVDVRADLAGDEGAVGMAGAHAGQEQQPAADAVGGRNCPAASPTAGVPGRVRSILLLRYIPSFPDFCRSAPMVGSGRLR